MSQGNYKHSKDANGFFLLLTLRQWCFALVVGGVLVFAAWPFYHSVSNWIGASLFVIGLATVHFKYSSRYVIPFPHVAFFMAALQYVLAAWLSYSCPPFNPRYDIGDRLPDYLSYAAPVLIACAIGWGLGFRNLSPVPFAKPIKTAPNLLLALDVLIVVGFIGVACSRFSIAGLGFVFVLIANLRFVGIYGRMLVKGPGWAWRVTLVMITEMVFATGNAMFQSFLIWGLWTFALWIYIFRPSWRFVIIAGFAALLLMPALQESKWLLRSQTWGDVDSEDAESSADKTFLWLKYLGWSFARTATGHLDPDMIGDLAMRYNQGWIINRVMQHVPAEEPYARGRTIVVAFTASLIPRLLNSDKGAVTGTSNTQRYAGIEMTDSTAMGLGFAGEMYANFGYFGGILGCGVYAFIFSWLFRLVCVRAFRSPLWWSFVPYVGFSAVKAEQGIAEVVNWTLKASLVVVGICIIFPAIRTALFPRGKRRVGCSESAVKKVANS
jgi:hypothetical protein